MNVVPILQHLPQTLLEPSIIQPMKSLFMLLLEPLAQCDLPRTASHADSQFPSNSYASG